MPLPLSCPLCNAKENKQSVVTRHVYGDTSKRHSFFHCGNCDVNYLFPRLDKCQEKEFYANEFSHFMNSRAGNQGGWESGASHVSANESSRLRRMIHIEPLLANDKMSILEIGCSSGFMLHPLIKEGHHCVGIEPSGIFQEYLKSKSVEVFIDLEDLDKDKGQFDIVMHFFVLEHMSDPVKFLKDQLKLLKKGGKIVFEVPNVADALYSIYDIGRFERFYWSIAHPWYFSENSLSFLLNQLNVKYKVLLDQRYDLSNHITWAKEGKPGGMGRYTEHLGEFEDLYRQKLIEIGKCDTLFAIIQK